MGESWICRICETRCFGEVCPICGSARASAVRKVEKPTYAFDFDKPSAKPAYAFDFDKPSAKPVYVSDLDKPSAEMERLRANRGDAIVCYCLYCLVFFPVLAWEFDAGYVWYWSIKSLIVFIATSIAFSRSYTWKDRTASKQTCLMILLLAMGWAFVENYIANLFSVTSIISLVVCFVFWLLSRSADK